MKRLWNAVSFVAVVNLLAMTMFGLWLWQSGRMDVERLRRLKEMLGQTIEAEQEVAAEQQAQTEADRQEAAEQARVADPPLPSVAQVRHLNLIDAQSRQAMQRLRDETDQHLARLAMERRQIEREQASLEAEKEAWQEATRAQRQQRTDEQFQKTVKLYESAKPKLAKQWMLNLVDDGEERQVVAYLNAMNSRAAKKILDEFKSEQDGQLATELLERLRTFGLGAGVWEDSSDERDDSAAPDQPGPP